MGTEHTTGWAPLTIVVGVDPDDVTASTTALALAAEFRARGLTRSIVVAHVVRQSFAQTAVGRDYADVALGRVEELAERAMLPYRDPGQPALDGVAIEICFGEPAEQLERVARDRGADLIVIGPRARTALQRPNGGLARALLAQHTIAIVVARPFTAAKFAAHGVDSDQPEPACPECLATRRESAGAQMWCDVHARPREPSHTVDPGIDEVRWSARSWYQAGR